MVPPGIGHTDPFAMTSWSVRPVEERPDPDVIATEVDRVDREDGSRKLKSIFEGAILIVLMI